MQEIPLRFIIAMLLCAPQIPLAQPPSLGVDEAIRHAIERAPGLAAAVRDAVAAQAGVRAARAMANPELVIAPPLTAGGSDEEFSIRQPFEVNGARSARTAVAAARHRGAQAAATVALRETVFATKTAYYELARARELLSLSQDLLKSAEELDRITNRQVELGSRPGIDRTQTAIEVTRARQQVIEAESRVTVETSALNTAMARSVDEPIGSLSALSAEPITVDPQVSLRDALSRRADIGADEAERDALRQEARLARAEGRPDIAAQFRAAKVFGGLEDAGFGIGITLPLLDHGGLRNRVRQADEAARAQEYRITARISLVRQEVSQAVARFRAADALLEEYKRGLLDQIRRLLNAARTGFQSGQTSVLAVLEAQRTYRNVQTEYTGALVDRALALAELERATGALPATLLPSSSANRPFRGRSSR
jgi:outer membrane protein, heavy metal efflux system